MPLLDNFEFLKTNSPADCILGSNLYEGEYPLGLLIDCSLDFAPHLGPHLAPHLVPVFAVEAAHLGRHRDEQGAAERLDTPIAKIDEMAIFDISDRFFIDLRPIF